MAGTWRAEYPAPGRGGDITLELTQLKDRVSGTGTVRSAADREPFPLTVSGRVADPDVTLHFATLAGCPASFYGRRVGVAGAYAADTLAGRLAPSPCLLATPALVFARQGPVAVLRASPRPRRDAGSGATPR